MAHSFLAASFVTEEKKSLILIITCLLSCPEVSNDKGGKKRRRPSRSAIYFLLVYLRDFVSQIACYDFICPRFYFPCLFVTVISVQLS